MRFAPGVVPGMHDNAKAKSVQAGCLILSIIVSWVNSQRLGATEFSGGWLTGRLLALHDGGLYLLIAALLLTFFFRRVTAGTALFAVLLSLPLYLYRLVPGPFRRLFRGEYTVPDYGIAVGDKWTDAAILTLAVVVYVCLRSLWLANNKDARDRESN